MDWQNMTKHDAHVIKAKMHFFPIHAFIFVAIFFFLIGMLVGSFNVLNFIL